jgi:hypothetical protein
MPTGTPGILLQFWLRIFAKLGVIHLAHKETRMKRYTPLAGMLIFMPLLTVALTAAPVPKEDDAARLRRLYGKPVDLDKDCKIELIERDDLRMTVPATPHVIAVPPRLNAPHTENEITGDFTASVRVAFPIRAASPPSRATGFPQANAGLIAIAGDEAVRLVRTEITVPIPMGNPPQEDFHFSYFSAHKQSDASTAVQDGPGKAGYLRLTRKGKVLTAFWGRDGKTWNEFRVNYPVEWGDTVRVGIVAENQYLAQFEATFSEFQISRPGK